MLDFWILTGTVGTGLLGVYIMTIYAPISKNEKKAILFVAVLFALFILIPSAYKVNIKREMNQEIYKFIDEGDKLRQSCETKEERYDLVQLANNWKDRVLNYLYSVNPSYASRVNTVTEPLDDINSIIRIPTFPNINREVWHFLDLRIKVLNEILKEIQ